MKRETKSFKLHIKSVDETGIFTGYASTFGNVDYGGDVIMNGAFKKSLKDTKGKKILLDGHDSWSGNGRIGVVNLEEDDKGLRVTKGVLNLEKQSGREALSDLKFYLDQGLPVEMSIGYTPVKVRYPGKDDPKNVQRYLDEVKLWETSLVTFGMNPKARTDSVKGAMQTLLTEAMNRLDKLEARVKGLGDSEENQDEALDASANAGDSPGAHESELVKMLFERLDSLGKTLQEL